MHRGRSSEQDLDQEQRRFGWMRSSASVSRIVNVVGSETAERSCLDFPFLKGLVVSLLPPGLGSSPSEVRRGTMGYPVFWYSKFFAFFANVNL